MTSPVCVICGHEVPYDPRTTHFARIGISTTWVELCARCTDQALVLAHAMNHYASAQVTLGLSVTDAKRATEDYFYFHYPRGYA